MNRLVAVALSLFSAGLSASATNILNGSFETTAYSIGFGCGNIAACFFGVNLASPNAFPNGVNSFAPWTFAAAAGATSGVGLVGSAINEPAGADGNQYAFLQGSNATISQSFTSTAGAKDTLSFLLADRTSLPGTGEAFSLTVDGNTYSVLADNASLKNAGWKLFTINFTGSGGTNLLQFTATGSDAILLDKVSISEVPAGVPEPASFLLAAAGLAVPFLRKRLGR